MDYSIAVIGGGAAGLTAAVAAARDIGGNGIVIIERRDRAGKKLLATGNGCCNLSNANVSITHYYGCDTTKASHIMDKFTPRDAIDFFDSIGVLCKTEAGGRIYPYSYQASAVVNAFRNELNRHCVETVTDFDAVNVEKTRNGFTIHATDGRRVFARKVIITTGGLASPQLGGNGGGYKLLKAFGHTISELNQALVQLKTDDKRAKSLSGIKFDGMLSVEANNRTVFTQTGEILFTDYGLSGPPILEASKFAFMHKDVTCILDFMPEYSEKELEKMLKGRRTLLSGISLEHFFNGFINNKIGMSLLKHIGLDKLSKPVSELSDSHIHSLARTIKGARFGVTGPKGWDSAQVTAGGALLGQFDENLESKLVKGLYAAGEILDIAGDCGGYNLHWAWASGYAAGRGAAQKC